MVQNVNPASNLRRVVPNACYFLFQNSGCVLFAMFIILLNCKSLFGWKELNEVEMEWEIVNKIREQRIAENCEHNFFITKVMKKMSWKDNGAFILKLGGFNSTLSW